jgi:hypothetical protein
LPNHAYQVWNRTLARRFFRTDCAGRPAYLSVDDEELEELAPQIGIEPKGAAASLAEAVKREFSNSQTSGLYREFLRAATEWRKDPGGPPPYIALLGSAVLAGSRMARDETQGVASHNYYRRYNELFGRDPGAGQPQGFEQLGRLWRDLDRWLDEDNSGRLGTSTVPEHPFPAHVGYPISQCLLRESDRRRLTEFFRDHPRPALHIPAQLVAAGLRSLRTGGEGDRQRERTGRRGNRRGRPRGARRVGG